jgi:hypothetical protein
VFTVSFTISAVSQNIYQQSLGSSAGDLGQIKYLPVLRNSPQNLRPVFHPGGDFPNPHL